MVFVCFPGKALSNDLINLPTLAFVNVAFESGAAIFLPAFSLIVERSKMGLLRIGATQFGRVAFCASS